MSYILQIKVRGLHIRHNHNHVTVYLFFSGFDYIGSLPKTFAPATNKIPLKIAIHILIELNFLPKLKNL
jgi:hypothetical protein